jgi:uncharacterized membrane protein/Mg-chelatase subunit ChlD
MDQTLLLLSRHGLGGLCLAVAAVLGGVLLIKRRRQTAWSIPLLVLGSAFALAGMGGLFLPHSWGWWVAGAALAILFVMLLVLVLTEHWWAPLGYAAGGLLLLGLGSAGAVRLSEALVETVKDLRSFQLEDPGWWHVWGPLWVPLYLLLLVLVPAIIWLSYRSMAGLGPVRRWLAIGLRCLQIVLLTLALAGACFIRQNDALTLLFLVDYSYSIPQDFDPKGANDDQRWERITTFINQSVANRGTAHKRDQAGVIVFGRRPRPEVPPTDSFGLNFKKVESTIDRNYTDIGGALKLALASFPPGTRKRMVLLSDGYENLGNAEEQLRQARHENVQIDVVALAKDYRNQNEVLVQSVEAPGSTEVGTQLPLKVRIRSYNPNPVVGFLELKQITDGQPQDVLKDKQGNSLPGIDVRLQPGLNLFRFDQSLSKEKRSYTYEATFHPKGIETPEGFKPGLPGDRVQNNRASTHVIAQGQRRILLIEREDGEHRLLARRLKAAGTPKFQVDVITARARDLPEDPEVLAVKLADYDCVILANVPADRLTKDQMEIFRSNTHDQGCGLVMIGGPESFGAGGWQDTPVEKALPVDCDVKSLKVEGKGGLVLIMHASEMAEGNYWQKEIAKLAIKKLSPVDMLGVIYFDWGKHTWHIPFQQIGDQRTALLRQVDKMAPGDMPDADPALRMAHAELTKQEYELAVKHIIFISDGDHWQKNGALLAQLKGSGITCSTVCITTHGNTERQKMKEVADATGGRFHNVTNPKELPSIYIQETRVVSQSFTVTKKFTPTLHFQHGPTKGLDQDLKPLYGYVRTTPKQSSLVETSIDTTSGDQRFPILAYWQYGLGKAIAFTSDARSVEDKLFWDRDWANSDMYAKFWEQVVDYASRARESGRLTMATEYRDGKIKVTVEIPIKDVKPKPGKVLAMRGAVTPPSPNADEARQLWLKFVEKNRGLYEAEVRAEEAGSYFINAQLLDWDGKTIDKKAGLPVGEVRDSLRGGVTIPYSPEFADIESSAEVNPKGPALLEKLRADTGGKEYAEEPTEDERDNNSLDRRDLEELRRLAHADARGEQTKKLAAALAADLYRADLPPTKSRQRIWPWLLALAGICLLLDVSVRRIALEPAVAVGAAQRQWDRLRGRRTVVAKAPEFLDRLKSRKEQIGEALERTRAAQRFEVTGPAASAPPGAEAPSAAAPPPPRRPAPPPGVGPQTPEEAADYASRLLKAKKRVWQDRDKDKDK